MEREAVLENLLKDTDRSFYQIVNRFHSPPLYSTNYRRGFGTLYTSIYYPGEKLLEICWPDSNWILGFKHFTQGQRVIQYQPDGAMTLQAF